MTVTKEDIVRKIAADTGYTTASSAIIMETIVAEMKECFNRGEDVLISGFGKFLVYEKIRTAPPHPNVKTPREGKLHRTVTFRTSTKLRKRLNAEEPKSEDGKKNADKKKSEKAQSDGANGKNGNGES
ncbi:MAG: HU family DNA-binding protein [Deltaproteobacteria bacterium]|jgi:integration host factor subunit alpha|nr:HU family DNA-binding protein [Deltaproteobacteria bacterium]